MHHDPQWKQLSDVMNAFVQTEILAAACRLRLFDFLDARPGASGAEVAAHFDLDGHGTRILLQGCRQAGLVAEENDGFHNTRTSQRFLTVRSAESVLNFVHFVHDVQQRSCRALLESLQSKEPRGLRELGAQPGQSLYELNAGRPEAEKSFHAAMSEYSGVVALPSVRELADHRHLLDVGGGDGMVAGRVCAEHSNLHCTVMDLPSVCERLLQRMSDSPLRKRVRPFAADIFRDRWPGGADAVLLSHFVEIFDPTVIQSLYHRAFDYLPPGGRLVLWTLTGPTDGELSVQAVKSSVYFLTTAGGRGMAYTAQEHHQWLEAAGFQIERIAPHKSTSHTLMIASKQKKEESQ